MHSSEQVAPHTKEVLHEPVHRQESLGVPNRLEPAHLALAVPRTVMPRWASRSSVSRKLRQRRWQSLLVCLSAGGGGL